MPTVVQDGEFTFAVHTRERPFEPPHVHVRFGGEEVRIELGAGTFMDLPPSGSVGRYGKHSGVMLTRSDGAGTKFTVDWRNTGSERSSDGLCAGRGQDGDRGPAYVGWSLHPFRG